MRVCTCVIKFININKYKQNRDDVKCNITVEIEIDVHGDVRPQNKQSSDNIPFFPHDRILYEWVKYNKCVRLPDSVGVLDCDSQFTILNPTIVRQPQLWCSVSVCSSLHLLTSAHCAQCSPSIPLWFDLQVLASVGGRKESPNRALCIPVSHDRWRVCFSFLLVHQAFWAWCSSRYNGSAVTHTKLICWNSYVGAAALSAPIMLLCYAFISASFASRNPSSLSVDSLHSQIHTICRSSLIATPSGCLPQKWFTKGTLHRTCTVSPDLFWLVLSSLFPEPFPPYLSRCIFLETLLVPTVWSCYFLCQTWQTWACFLAFM